MARGRRACLDPALRPGAPRPRRDPVRARLRARPAETVARRDLGRCGGRCRRARLGAHAPGRHRASLRRGRALLGHARRPRLARPGRVRALRLPRLAPPGRRGRRHRLLVFQKHNLLRPPARARAGARRARPLPARARLEPARIRLALAEYAPALDPGARADAADRMPLPCRTRRRGGRLCFRNTSSFAARRRGRLPRRRGRPVGAALRPARRRRGEPRLQPGRRRARRTAARAARAAARRVRRQRLPLLLDAGAARAAARLRDLGAAGGFRGRAPSFPRPPASSASASSSSTATASRSASSFPSRNP